jgi:serine protease AprX
LAAGAVDGNNIISDFSSAGPSADGRIKPDNVAMGVSVPVQTTGNIIGRSSGTSFSCPVLSGMAACLLQAFPRAINSDIIKVFHSSADRYSSPDSLYGYGIPDINLALTELQYLYLKIPETRVIAFPNPTSGDIEVIFHSPPEKVTIEIISTSGKLIYKKTFSDYAGSVIAINELEHKEQGVYLVRVITGSEMNVLKIIKINN